MPAPQQYDTIIIKTATPKIAPATMSSVTVAGSSPPSFVGAGVVGIVGSSTGVCGVGDGEGGGGGGGGGGDEGGVVGGDEGGDVGGGEGHSS